MIWKKVYVILARVSVLNDNNILVTRTLLCGVRVNNTLSFVSTVLSSESHTDNFIFNFFILLSPELFFLIYSQNITLSWVTSMIPYAPQSMREIK